MALLSNWERFYYCFGLNSHSASTYMQRVNTLLTWWAVEGEILKEIKPVPLAQCNWFHLHQLLHSKPNVRLKRRVRLIQWSWEVAGKWTSIFKRVQFPNTFTSRIQHIQPELIEQLKMRCWRKLNILLVFSVKRRSSISYNSHIQDPTGKEVWMHQ